MEFVWNEILVGQINLIELIEFNSLASNGISQLNE